MPRRREPRRRSKRKDSVRAGKEGYTEGKVEAEGYVKIDSEGGWMCLV